MVFTRDGLRGANMERIATEAGVSRATLYTYFADKEDAFVQASQHIADQLIAVVDFALDSAGTVVDRLRQAMLAMLEIVWRTARASPLAAELLDSRERLTGPIFAAAERHIVAALAGALQRAGIEDANATAYVLLLSGKGIAYAAPDMHSMQRGVTLLVEGLIRGMQAPRD